LTRVRALAALSGLPSDLDLTVGPISMSDRFHVGYNATGGKVGRFDAHVEADGVEKLGNARALVVLVPVPNSVSVDGRIGDKSDITVTSSDRLEYLGAGVTGFLGADESSGGAVLKQVPRKITLKWEGFSGKTNTPGLPKLSYQATESQGAEDLDSLVLAVGVEAKMILADSKEAGQPKVGTGNLGLIIDRLARTTTFDLDPAGRINLKSDPVPTSSVHIIGNLTLELPYKDFTPDPPVFDCKGFTGEFEGHLEVKPSKVERFDVVVTSLRQLTMRPGQKRFDLGIDLVFGWKVPLPGIAPAENLFQAIDGDYSQVRLLFYGVDLKPNIDLKFRIFDNLIEKDRLVIPVQVTEATDFIRMRAYDWDHESLMHLVVQPGDIDVLFPIRPGLSKIAQNVMILDGGKPQMINLLDLGGQIEGQIIDFLAAGVWPYNGDHNDPGGPPC
jgi:hypothetical protein